MTNPTVKERMSPRELLYRLEGDKKNLICGCGRPLERIIHRPSRDVISQDGFVYFRKGEPKSFVQHSNPDDEDHHMWFFSGIRIDTHDDEKED